MKLKLLFTGQKFNIAATFESGTFPVEDFLACGDANIAAYIRGLKKIIQHVADNGLDGCPTNWVHEASKDKQIYEFIKGPMRIFFFKGEAETIAVCTGHTRKSGQKADKSCVAHADSKRKDYFEAVANGTIEFEIEDEDDENGLGEQEDSR